MEPGDAAEGYLKHSRTIKGAQYDLCRGLLSMTDIKPGDHVFDIGCGTGEYAADLAKDVLKNGHITACDPHQKRITVAQERFGNLTNLTYIHAGGSDALQGKLGVYDVVYSSAVLHWMSDEEQEKTIQNSFLAMKSGAVAAHLALFQQPDYAEKFVPYFSEDLKKEYYDMLNPADVFVDWLDLTWYGKFGFKDVYKKFGDKIELEKAADGQIFGHHPLFKLVAVKP